MSRMYRIAEFAQLAGVTVCTLQYDDRIDLLKPSDCTQAKEASRIYHQRSNKNGNDMDKNKRNLSSNDCRS